METEQISKEKELHEKVQELRNEFATYIKDYMANDTDFKPKITNWATGINNKFVEILMLNEMIHKEIKGDGKNGV